MARLRGARWQAEAIIDGKRSRPSFPTREEAEAYERDPTGEQVRPMVGPMFRHGRDLIYAGTKNEVEAVRLIDKLIAFFGEGTLVSTITTARA